MFNLVARNRLRSLTVFVLMFLMLMGVGALSVGAYDVRHCVTGALIGLTVAVGFALYGYFLSSTVVLSHLGARAAHVKHDAALINVVEEMVIASGLSVRPAVCVVDTDGCNAFVIGRSPKKSTIVVTRGLLQLLDRDQLQGVVAHELSHIVHRDILFMSLLMAITQGIETMSAMQGLIAGDSSGRDMVSRGSGGAWGGVLRLAVYCFGGTMARLMFLLANRTREYMADASAVVFTRNPGALASALKKIAEQQGKDTHRFGKALDSALTVSVNLHSTHPPVQTRIDILERLAGGSHITLHNYAQVYKDVTQASL